MKFAVKMIWAFIIGLVLTGPTLSQETDSGDDLREAARAGNLDQVTALLQKGVDVNSPARHNVTPLRLAAERGQMAVVKLLIERGADLNADETFFNSSIVAAALRSGQKEIAVLLLESGAKDRAGALNWAINQDDVELAQLALKNHTLDAMDLAVARKAAAEKSEGLRELLANAEATPRPLPVSLTPQDLQHFAGTYRSRGQNMVVTSADHGLSVQVGEGEAINFHPISPNRFLNESGDARVEFSGRAGTIEWSSIVRADGEALFFSAANTPEPASVESASDASLETVPRSEPKPWRQFRGEFSSGIGDGQGAPAKWNVETGENIRFKTPIPGIGLSSPIIDSGRIFVTTAISSKGDTTFRTGLYGDGTSVDDVSPHSFRLYAIDAATGSIVWDREVANVSPTVKRHLKSSLANSSPVTDGKHIVC